MLIDNIVCSACGKKSLDLSVKNENNILCCEYKNDNYGISTIFTCTNKECKTYGKGYWYNQSGEWHSYLSSDSKLIGESIYKCGFLFGDDIYPGKLFFGNFSWKEQCSKYHKGIYVGQNWKTKCWRLYGLLKSKVYAIMVLLKRKRNFATKN